MSLRRGKNIQDCSSKNIICHPSRHTSIPSHIYPVLPDTPTLKESPSPAPTPGPPALAHPPPHQVDQGSAVHAADELHQEDEAQAIDGQLEIPSNTRVLWSLVVVMWSLVVVLWSLVMALSRKCGGLGGGVVGRDRRGRGRHVPWRFSQRRTRSDRDGRLLTCCCGERGSAKQLSVQTS